MFPRFVACLRCVRTAPAANLHRTLPSPCAFAREEVEVSLNIRMPPALLHLVTVSAKLPVHEYAPSPTRLPLPVHMLRSG